MGSPRRVLVLFAHPALEKSRVNRLLAKEVEGITGVTFHDLYEAYPDFGVDVKREQTLLSEHDAVVFQHPLFWYSTPALLKEWQDLVLEHGWAYGSEGTALDGKLWLSVVTTGGRETAYSAGGYNRFTIRELLRPLEQTAVLCGMRFLPPFIVHGTHGMDPASMRAHATDYRRMLEALSEGTLDLERTEGMDRINAHLDTIIPG